MFDGGPGIRSIDSNPSHVFGVESHHGRPDLPPTIGRDKTGAASPVQRRKRKRRMSRSAMDKPTYAEAVSHHAIAIRHP